MSEFDRLVERAKKHPLELGRAKAGGTPMILVFPDGVKGPAAHMFYDDVSITILHGYLDSLDNKAAVERVLDAFAQRKHYSSIRHDESIYDKCAVIVRNEFKVTNG